MEKEDFCGAAPSICGAAPRNQGRHQQDSTVISKESYLEMSKYLLIYFLIGWENFMKTIFRRIKKFKKSVCNKQNYLKKNTNKLEQRICSPFDNAIT